MKLKRPLTAAAAVAEEAYPGNSQAQQLPAGRSGRTRVQPQPAAVKGDAGGRKAAAREPAAVKGKANQPGAGKGTVGGRPSAGSKEPANGGRAATPGGGFGLDGLPVCIESAFVLRRAELGLPLGSS